VSTVQRYSMTRDKQKGNVNIAQRDHKLFTWLPLNLLIFQPQLYWFPIIFMFFLSQYAV